MSWTLSKGEESIGFSVFPVKTFLLLQSFNYILSTAQLYYNIHDISQRLSFSDIWSVERRKHHENKDTIDFYLMFQAPYFDKSKRATLIMLSLSWNMQLNAVEDLLWKANVIYHANDQYLHISQSIYEPYRNRKNSRPLPQLVSMEIVESMLRRSYAKHHLHSKHYILNT